MNKKIIGLSVLALSMSMSQATLAYSDHAQRFSGERLEKITESLDLNTDQKAKIKAIREKSKQDLQPKFVELQALQQQMNQLLAAPTVDESKLDALIDQEKETFGAILKSRVMERRDISNVLTEQQKTKFSEMIQQWEKKRLEKKKD